MKRLKLTLRWRPRRGMSAALSLVSFAGSIAMAQGPSSSDDPPSRAGRISFVQGSVSFQPSGATDWSQATLNYTVSRGDRLYTDAGGRAEIEVSAMALRLGEGTDVTISELGDQFMQVALSQGTLVLSIRQLGAGDSVEVDTPNGAIGILNVGTYRFEALGGDSTTLVTVQRGAAELWAPGVTQGIRNGATVRLYGTNPVTAENENTPRMDTFDAWSADRDRRYYTSASARYVGQYTPGYADLDQNGRWETDVTYGTVWYPTVVVTWAPYRYGHWAWIEPWGWVWVENEPWGFVPFHYGRWVFLRNRWGWVPGPVVLRPVYSPAFVVWANGANWGAGVQAWFPLGPGEPYHPWYHRSDDYFRRVNATSLRGVDVDVVIRRPVTTVTYVNRGWGMTAVSGDVFRGGREVGRSAIHIDRDAAGRAAIAAHPNVAPTSATARGGMPIRREPPVGPRPSVYVRATGPDVRQTGRPDVRPTEPQRRPPQGRPYEPAPTRPDVHPVPSGRTSGDARTPHPLVVRNTPPQQNPPFSSRERALQEHPGRPLEPQQVDNIRHGRPAGPQKDSEAPADKPQARGGRDDRGRGKP